MEGHAEAGLSQLCEGRALTESASLTGNRSLVSAHQQPGTGAELEPARDGGGQASYVSV